MNRTAILADGFLISALAYPITTVTHNGVPVPAALVLLIGLCVVTIVLAPRLHTIRSRVWLLSLETVAVFALSTAFFGSLTMVPMLLVWAIAASRHYRDLDDVTPDKRQWRRLFVDVGILLFALLLAINSAAAVENATTGLVVIAITLRLLALRRSEVAYARSNGASYVTGILSSSTGISLAVLAALVLLVLFHTELGLLLSFLLYPVIWVLFQLVSLLTLRLPKGKPHVNKQAGFGKHPNQPILHHLSRPLPINWNDVTLTVLFLILAGALTVLILRSRYLKHRDLTDPATIVIARKRLVKRAPTAAPTALRALFARFASASTSSGRIKRMSGTTATEMSRQVDATSPATSSSVLTLVTAYEQERYGDHTIPDGQVRDLESALSRDGWLEE